MITYVIPSGELRDAENNVIGTGYSGKGSCKNDPTTCDLPNLGPIPPGLYKMGDPVDTVTHGPYVLSLDPSVDNKMYGRAGFLMHGDSVIEPGTASEGCIIMSRPTRQRAAAEPDRMLQVTATDPL